MSPFLWALVIRSQNSQSYRNIYSQNKFKGPIWVMRLIKILLGVFFIIFLLRRVFSLHVALYAAIVILVFLIVFRHWLQKLYDRIEERFITILHNREIEAQNELALAEAQKRIGSLGPGMRTRPPFTFLPKLTIFKGKQPIDRQGEKQMELK